MAPILENLPAESDAEVGETEAPLVRPLAPPKLDNLPALPIALPHVGQSEAEV